MARLPARSKGALSQLASESYVTRRLVLPAQDFIHRSGVSGALLVLASLIALSLANSPWQHAYHGFWDTPVRISIGSIGLTKSLHHLVNDGLMAIFFFVIGLEIKRELLQGELSSISRALTPIIGALGGMIVPALLYVVINYGDPGIRGWGIPIATDIAFALAVLALAGRYIPPELRVLLLAIAIVDDIGGILVIAVFYTEKINLWALAFAVCVVFFVIFMRRLGFRAPASYVIAAILLWLVVLKSGVHATLAGVVLGALTPIKGKEPGNFAVVLKELEKRYQDAVLNRDDEAAAVALGRLEEAVIETEPPLERAERLLHPWVTGLVLPLFALANAGVTLSWNGILTAAQSPVAVGVSTGLILGKLAGILSFCWIASSLGIAKLPGRVTWSQMAGMATVAGIGFTVSLFIASLSFTDELMLEHAKVGILFASLVAATAGALLLKAVGSAPSERRARTRSMESASSH
jgi:Na+:H+ antiporter, NhaA family